MEATGMSASVETDLGTVGSTLYTTLYAKGRAAQDLPATGFADPTAAEWLERADVDESMVLTNHSNTAGTIHRTMAIDEATVAFGRLHPGGQIVSAGIGLCTRRERLAGRVPDGMRWFGVDTPDVVTLRGRIAPGSDVEVVTASLTERGWAGVLDAAPPTLVIAEGVLMYLDPEGLATFLAEVRDHFGPGTEILADYFHPRIALSDRHPIVKATGAKFLSGARNGAALAEVVDGYALVDEYDVMERLGFGQHAAARVFRLVSRGGRMYAVAHLRAI